MRKKISKEIQKWSQKKTELDTNTTESRAVEDDSGAQPSESVAEATPVINVCLLCKRQFNTPEALKKHEALSELHMRNLELESTKEKEKYRPKQKESTYREASVKVDPLNENNKGAQLLQKMGWKQGEGIGKNSVVTTPIEVEIRSEKSGLGRSKSSEDSATKKRARWGDEDPSNKHPKV